MFQRAATKRAASNRVKANPNDGPGRVSAAARDLGKRKRGRVIGFLSDDDAIGFCAARRRPEGAGTWFPTPPRDAWPRSRPPSLSLVHAPCRRVRREGRVRRAALAPVAQAGRVHGLGVEETSAKRSATTNETEGSPTRLRAGAVYFSPCASPSRLNAARASHTARSLDERRDAPAHPFPWPPGAAAAPPPRTHARRNGCPARRRRRPRGVGGAHGGVEGRESVSVELGKGRSAAERKANAAQGSARAAKPKKTQRPLTL